MAEDRTDFAAALAANREFFTAGKRYSVAHRRMVLTKLRNILLRDQERVLAALYADLGKSEYEARVSELLPALASLKFMIRQLPRLARGRLVGVSAFNFPGWGRLRPEPYGQVLLFGTWNYPLLLVIDPLAAALAAGNRVVIKLSPQAPAMAGLLGEIFTEAFGAGEVTLADRDMSFDAIFTERFDYVFFTGGIEAGQEVYRRAAATMTPVTLELGGKSPCIVDEHVNVKVAARRIVWGKFLNAGQTCVAPDYLLVHRRVKDDLVNAMRESVREFFGVNPAENPDYPRIVNDTHFARLEGLMERGRLITGGEKNRTTLYMAPTILDQLTGDDPVMKEEIFGPILPVLEVSGMDEAIAFVNARPKPLALYYFGSRRNRARVIDSTSSGGVAVNDTVMQLDSPTMPFGGVGASGMGAYHGKYGFETFSHLKPILYKGFFPDLSLRYPPFGAFKRLLVRILSR